MTNIRIPEGHAFVPRRPGVNVALELLNAAVRAGDDRDTVKTVQGGYHVLQSTAEQYAASQPEAADAVETEPGSEAAEPVELQGEKVPDDTWTVAEIEKFAADQTPPIALPSDGKKADKLKAVLDGLPKAEATPAETTES